MIIHRWQASGIVTKQLVPILNAPNANPILRRSRRICLALMCIIFMFLIGVMVASRFNDGKSETFSYKKIFNDIPALYIGGRLIGWYMITAFLIVNYYFHSATAVVCEELELFNWRFKVTFLVC